MLLDWPALADGSADAFDGESVEIIGWMAPAEFAPHHDYFLLASEALCCFGCLPSDPGAAIEIFASEPIAIQGRAIRLTGILRRLVDDPAGWRYQLRAARLIETAEMPAAITRRGLLAAGALLSLGLSGPRLAQAADRTDAAVAIVLDGTVTVDLHSHAGRVLGRHKILDDIPFEDVAAPMRAGGMAVICLAIVADALATQVTQDRRISAFRQPAPGELYAWSRQAFARARALIADQKLAVIDDAAGFRAASRERPSVIVAAEGADFLEGNLDRIDEAQAAYQLRNLQLTHYRVNELGDIQTEAPVHGGLTDFGAAVIRRCNALGVVVDIAHGTLDLVRRATQVTSKPLILSHTSLADEPKPRSRLISVEHARLVADTGGVVGIWPPSSVFETLSAFAGGIARMVDAIGIDHVGLGSDMLGLLTPSVFPTYRDLPALAAALRDQGFHAEEIGKILGGNYTRAFLATIG